MDIEVLEKAIADAKSRGLKSVYVIVNTSFERFCEVDIQEISVSDLTGMVIYLQGCDKDFIGFLKDQKK